MYIPSSKAKASFLNKLASQEISSHKAMNISVVVACYKGSAG